MMRLLERASVLAVYGIAVVIGYLVVYWIAAGLFFVLTLK